ncbi:MAG TPA: hypothetical protein VLL48_05030, partial [Longimicrobiales bacterium]|nr:hypothetical protein [Longimicrobiales bacterium]
MSPFPPLRILAPHVLAATYVGVVACGGDLIGVGAEPLTEQVVTDEGIYHFAAGDSVDVEWQDRYYVWLQDRMGVRLSRRL